MQIADRSLLPATDSQPQGLFGTKGRGPIEDRLKITFEFMELTG